MSTEKPSSITDEEVAASLGAACMFVTRESIKDMRRALETFVAGRATSLCAPSVEPVGWMYRDQYNTLKLAQTDPPPAGSFPVYASPSAPQPAEGWWKDPRNFDVVDALSAAPQPVAVEPRWPDGLLERVKAAEQRIADNQAPRRIPADVNDVDLVLAEVRYLIEGRWPPFWLKLAASSPQEKDRVEVSHCSGCGLPGPNPCGQLGCPSGVKVEGGSDA